MPIWSPCMKASTRVCSTLRPPLARIRLFFETTREKYREEGYLGCLMGGLGQELSGVSEVFARKIDWCLSSISERMAKCLTEAQERGDIPATRNVQEMADLLVDCWEGAALRSRLRRNPSSLNAMLDFYIGSVAVGSRAQESSPAQSLS